MKMSREIKLYEEMKREDERQTKRQREEAKANGKSQPAAIVTPPIEDMMFFPTKEDRKVAKKWLKQTASGMHLRSTLALVSTGVAVPLALLQRVRELEEGRTAVETKADAADRAYVEEDNKRLAGLE